MPADRTVSAPTRHRWSSATRLSLLFVAVALACLAFADLSISTLHPWQEMARFFMGFVTPEVDNWSVLGQALVRTLAYAFVGVTLGCTLGFGLALLFHYRIVRAGCAFVRAIHELFWALIFLQFFGFHPLTGVLAICIPYAGVFAKVYAEILGEVDPTPEDTLPAGVPVLARMLYTRVPQAWPHLVAYTSYRLECGMRSSAVLGFVGMPTLGFYLESAFSQGYYEQVGALLILFYLLIATLRFWVRPWTIWLCVAVSPFFLGSGLPIVWGNVVRFFTGDIVPAPLRGGWGPDTLSRLGDWLHELIVAQALPGIWNTLVLTQIALVATGMVTLLLFPLISRHFGGPLRRALGHVVLVVTRSTPEYILAYMLLVLWGPSMLPAIVALALHNGGVIGYLVGRQSNALTLRDDAPTGVNRYFYELLPRLYPSFLAFLFYRWEIILRETAILGILGIHTLGFFVDSAIQEIRFDRALVLILVTAFLNMGVDSLSRRLRGRLRLTQASHCQA